MIKTQTINKEVLGNHDVLLSNKIQIHKDDAKYFKAYVTPTDQDCYEYKIIGAENNKCYIACWFNLYSSIDQPLIRKYKCLFYSGGLEYKIFCKKPLQPIKAIVILFTDDNGFDFITIRDFDKWSSLDVYSEFSKKLLNLIESHQKRFIFKCGRYYKIK